MATAEEVLQTMAEVPESAPVCVIDPETRTIIMPPEYQLFGVENDKRTERLYFQCPKIVGDNQDLSRDYQLFINYQNANGDPDAYHIKDMEVDGDNITFSWLLEENVTKYRGNIQFAFGAIIPGDETEDPDKNRWNTTINTDCTCLVGLKCTQQVAESNPDALVQIWAAIDELKAGGGGGGAPGKDGREIEIQNSGTAIQWRYAGDGSWTDLVQLSEITGSKGDPGETPNIQIGTVQTLEPGQQATASMTGTPENPLLNLGIPKGEKGDPGEDAESGDPYTLPIMSDTQLGGGKAVEKTDEDVPVAVDPSTGQLFVPTYPENTGYKWIACGYMREHVRDFQGWAHCVQYDKELGKAVGIVISGTGSHSNSAPLYRVTIENNGYMSEYEEMVFNYPETDTAETGYIGSFIILDDGTYWCCDSRQRIFISSDKGCTWDFVTQLTLNGRSTYNNDSLFGVTVLDNGRFVGGNIGNVASETYYSDNDLDWTTVVMDVSQLGQQTYPEGGFVPFEPFFIDCGNGKVIQYARASMNAYKTYAEGAWTKQEGAVYSVSDDYGTTWTPWQWSKSIVDMTANNGKVVVIGDVVHCVYGSRYLGYTDEYGNTPFFALRYTHTTLEKVLTDTWEESVVVDVGHWDETTAERKADCGYPSIWKDENNNLFVVYYDSDESGTAYGANWRLLFGNPYVQKKAIEDGGSGSKNVAYSQFQTEILVQRTRENLMVFIMDLYNKLNSLPPDSGDNDGDMPIMDGLIRWWQYSGYTDGIWTDSVKSNALTLNATQEDDTSLLSLSSPITIGTLTSLGLTVDFSFEASVYMTTTGAVMRNGSGMWVNDFKLDQAAFTTPNKNVVSFNVNGEKNYPFRNTYKHAVITFEKETGLYCVYVNGNKVVETTDTTEINSTYSLMVFNQNTDKIGNIKLYNKALTENEVSNNYKYEKKTYTFS